MKTSENVVSMAQFFKNYVIEKSCPVLLMFSFLFVIWCHLHNLKNVKSTHGGVLLLVIKLQALAYKFTKSDTPPLLFFTFFSLCN